MIDIPTWAEFTDFIITQIKTNDLFAAAGFFSALGLSEHDIPCVLV